MTLVFTLLVLLVAAVVAAAFLKQHLARDRTSDERIRARRALTPREQAMYFRLQQTFPELVVMGQVAFSALLAAHQRRTRNRFDRKVADFVLFTRAFDVLAVIELDDASHAGRRVRDAARAQLLEDAGYTVLRFAHVPDVADLLAAVPHPPAPAAEALAKGNPARPLRRSAARPSGLQPKETGHHVEATRPAVEARPR